MKDSKRLNNYTVCYRWKEKGAWHHGRTVVSASTPEKARIQFQRTNPHVQCEEVKGGN